MRPHKRVFDDGPDFLREEKIAFICVYMFWHFLSHCQSQEVHHGRTCVRPVSSFSDNQVSASLFGYSLIFILLLPLCPWL